MSLQKFDWTKIVPLIHKHICKYEFAYICAKDSEHLRNMNKIQE